MPQLLSLALALALASQAGATSVAPPAVPSSRASKPAHTRAIRFIPLPGAPASGGVGMDYIAFDRAHHRVWVPAGNTASLDAIDTSSGAVSRVSGFKTAEFVREGIKRTVGPSSITVADGIVYVGNRGDSSVCAVDEATLKLGACLTLDASPDGIAWIASTKEVWVTTPRDKSIRVLDASKPGSLTQKARIVLDGEPEGYAVDDARGVLYTNLEDADRTLTIDLATRRVTRTWLPACGEDGPKGLALDHAADVLFVACPDHVIALDAAHGGARLASVEAGAGIDNIDYVEARHELFVAAGRVATLVVARFDAPGTLTAIATVKTASGARNAVATDDGEAYLIDSPEGKILVVAAAGAIR